MLQKNKNKYMEKELGSWDLVVLLDIDSVEHNNKISKNNMYINWLS